MLRSYSVCVRVLPVRWEQGLVPQHIYYDNLSGRPILQVLHANMVISICYELWSHGKRYCPSIMGNGPGAWTGTILCSLSRHRYLVTSAGANDLHRLFCIWTDGVPVIVWSVNKCTTCDTCSRKIAIQKFWCTSAPQPGPTRTNFQYLYFLSPEI